MTKLYRAPTIVFVRLPQIYMEVYEVTSMISFFIVLLIFTKPQSCAFDVCLCSEQIPSH